MSHLIFVFFNNKVSCTNNKLGLTFSSAGKIGINCRCCAAGMFARYHLIFSFNHCVFGVACLSNESPKAITIGEFNVEGGFLDNNSYSILQFGIVAIS